jgi:hypothetical protein
MNDESLRRISVNNILRKSELKIRISAGSER